MPDDADEREEQDGDDEDDEVVPVKERKDVGNEETKVCCEVQDDGHVTDAEVPDGQEVYDKTMQECVEESPQVLSSWVDALVRGPQSDWRAIRIDQYGDFSLTQKCVLEVLHD